MSNESSSIIIPQNHNKKKSILKDSSTTSSTSSHQNHKSANNEFDDNIKDNCKTNKLLSLSNNNNDNKFEQSKNDTNSNNNEYPDHHHPNLFTTTGETEEEEEEEEARSDCGSNSSTTIQNNPQHRTPFGSKRFQQIWFAVKRFSPIHRPSSGSSSVFYNNNNNKESTHERKRRKFSVGYENDHFVVEPIDTTARSKSSSNPRLFWSPFTRRRVPNGSSTSKNSNNKRFRLYSSHPDISSTKLNTEQFLEDAKVSYHEDDDYLINDHHQNQHHSTNVGTRWNQFTGSRSPLNKFRKIKRDMRRCVQRIPSSDYDLSGGGGVSASAAPTGDTDFDIIPVNDLATSVEIKHNNSVESNTTIENSQKPQSSAEFSENNTSRTSQPQPDRTTTTNNQTPTKRNILDSISDMKKPKLFSKNSKTSTTIDSQQSNAIDTEDQEMILRVEYSESGAQIVSTNGDNTQQGAKRQTSAEIALENAQNYESVIHRQRISKLLQYPFFQVDINIRSAQNLQAKDACGTSDPYVKFKVHNQIVFKSRTIFKSLNPKWDEYFVLPVEDIFEPIMLKVYDHDYFFMDDYLGTAHIDLTKIEPGILTELELFLHETEESDKANIDEGWGKIFLTVKLNPKSQEEKDHFYGRGKWALSTGGSDGLVKKIKSQPWDSSVNILLISGENIALDTDYCIKFKLSNEKYKSKVILRSVRSPFWTEQFDMHLFTGQSKMLEIALCPSNQNDSIDKIIVDLGELETDQTHKLVKQFPGLSQAGKCKSMLEMLITVTGTVQVSTSELDNHRHSPLINVNSNNNLRQTTIGKHSIATGNNCSSSFGEFSRRYNIFNCLSNIFDIGHLQVKVYKAENLASADLNGKSDPFCVLELVNNRLQTNTEYKTLSPEWNKLFTFNVKDIHSVLELTVYDEDRDRVEFLGKVGIPLLKIKNGDKKWYALKDKKLRNRVKGHILLEFWLNFSKFKASVRTMTPREMKYIQPEIKFKRSLFVRNANRLKNLCLELVEMGQFMNSCILWKSPLRSLIAFILSLTFIYIFELYMAPLILFLFLMKNYICIKIRSYFDPNFREEEIQFIDENVFDDDEDDIKTEEKKSLKERLQTVQETTTLVMNIIGDIASYIERVKNTANFSVPFLSWLAIVCMVIATIILYHIPVRYLIMAWCINKFTKKFRAPDAINNNEIMDFLSRVPDMEEKNMYKEFKPNISKESEQQQQQSPIQITGSGISQQSNNSNSRISSANSNNRKRLDRTISGDSSCGSVIENKKKSGNKKSK